MENWPDAEPLAFETIELENDAGPAYWRGQSDLLILTDAVNVAEVEQYISPEALQCVRNLDSNTYISILVFRGYQGSVHEGFKIMHLFQQNDEMIIVAQKGSQTRTAAESSPYHLISIPKSASWQGEVTFSLYFLHHDQPVLRIAHPF